MVREVAVKYSDIDYVIKKQISVEFAIDMVELSKRGYFAYVIENTKHKFKFLYVTTKYYFEGSKILGKSLKFKKGDLSRKLNLMDYTDIFGRHQLTFSMDKSKNSKFSFVPADIGLEKRFKGGKTFHINKFKIHTKKVCFDEPFWFENEIQNLKVDNHKKKFFKTMLNNAEIDDRIRKVMISELFISKNNKYQDLNSHSLILTQGSTGKSSILGVLGSTLDTTSNSGVYGYYSTNKDQWIGGVVSRTDDCLIFDELNEVISKMNTARSENILSNINTPLEQGKFSYAKAGGREIDFGNQFVFMANISMDFHFENFLIGVATNIETIGRRFAYIIYDDKVKFKNGGRRPKETTLYFELLKNYLSYVWEYCVSIRQITKSFENDSMVKLENDFKKRINKELKKIEHENTKKFLDYFCKKSTDSRLKNMALKLAIFDNLDDIIKTKNLPQYQFSNIVTKMIKEYEGLLIDIESSIKNIIEHQNMGLISESNNEIQLDKFHQEKKSIKEIAIAVFRNLEVFDKTTKALNYKKIREKGDLKYLRKNLINNKTSTSKINKQLLPYGIILFYKEKEINFKISHQVNFSKYVPAYLQYLESVGFDTKEINNKYTTKEELKKNIVESKSEMIEKYWNTSSENDKYDINKIRQQKKENAKKIIEETKKEVEEESVDTINMLDIDNDLY